MTVQNENLNNGLVIGVLIIMVLVTGIMTNSCTRIRMHDEAVEAGVAHYVVDPQTGKTTFEYLPGKDWP